MSNDMITFTSQVLLAALLLSLTAGNCEIYKHCLASGGKNFVASVLIFVAVSEFVW